jgi:4,5-dihydroxyphthalate decarboxylase
MLEVSLATSQYDRTAAFHDGRVTIEGCTTRNILIDAPGEIFHRAFGFQEFDIAELSLCSHMLTTARGDAKYVAIPAFPLRMFRHSGVYIRTDRGIDRPEDLRGKTVGLPEYQQTANVWVRGMLDDEHGVDIRSVRWRTGGRDEPGRQERTEVRLPAGIDWQVIPPDRTLSDMLEKGEIDALISPRPPRCFARKDRCEHVDHLFPDYPSVELEYFKRTRIFPIMHVVGIRRALVDKHPWLPVSVFKAFLKAKEVIDLRNSTLLPWADAEYKRMESLLGEDYWSYHLEPNRHVIETFARYAVTQGLIERPIAPDDLFAPSTLSLARS